MKYFESKYIRISFYIFVLISILYIAYEEIYVKNKNSIKKMIQSESVKERMESVRPISEGDPCYDTTDPGSTNPVEQDSDTSTFQVKDKTDPDDFVAWQYL